MDCAVSPDPPVAAGIVDTAKLVVVGPFAVGKTTLVGALSEITPVTTEEPLTDASVGLDTAPAGVDKTSTTVGLDWGRLTLGDCVLYLFGAPGQHRFLHLWPTLARGALGALVLVDTRRPEASYTSMDLVEQAGLPCCVAVNTFPESPRHNDPELRRAWDLHPDTPLVTCNARHRSSSLQAAITLLEHAIAHRHHQDRAS